MQSGFTVELWDELRAYAQRHAESAEPLPLYADCLAWIAREVDRRKLLVHPDAMEFYARELCSMIYQLREALQSR